MILTSPQRHAFHAHASCMRSGPIPMCRQFVPTLVLCRGMFDAKFRDKVVVRVKVIVGGGIRLGVLA